MASAQPPKNEIYDLLIIGGGINGCGIARDAAGRGLKVALCEKGDLAQATSSASTKLFHGGLRYLEHHEFRLVREALKERETLLKAMPHISWPLRFVLPHHSGLRPKWLLRMGLFIYDHLGGRKILPPTKSLDLLTDEVGTPLKGEYRSAFEYSDCWVEDARLVVLNARDADEHGADIWTRTQLLSARRDGKLWHAVLRDLSTDQDFEITAKGLVNAGGPWVKDLLNQSLGQNTSTNIRLVRGSHIVTSKLYDHDRAYIFQQSDGRIIFAIPYETDFTLIGTTDVDHDGDPGAAHITDEEIAYLCHAASEYFDKPITKEDVVWTYSGVRPLFDDGASAASQLTRDYVLKVEDRDAQTPLLNVFGGKITTYRKLSEEAMKKLSSYFPAMGDPWTAGAAMPGGNFPVDAVATEVETLKADYSFLDDRWAQRLIKAYGLDARELLGEAQSEDDLGKMFGATLTEAELEWLVDKEWARTGDDILWRRTKLGLRLTKEQAAEVDAWVNFRCARSLSETHHAKV